MTTRPTTILRHSYLLLSLLLAGCSEEVAEVSPLQDAWYHEVDLDAHEFVNLPLFLYSPVKPGLVSEAIAALGDEPLLQLSTSEARRYATNELRTVRQLRPFLIHALYQSQLAFNVSIADRALWVDSADAPHDTAPMRRHPLVIYFDEVPPDVYVTVGHHTREAARAEDAKAEN